MPEKSRLMPISYYNPKQAIRLSAYADTIVLEPDGREQHLRAIRFGGYPEMVRAMSDAIYAGATLETEFAGETAMLTCEPKKYECHLSHDGIYAEATILSLDDADTAAKKDEDAQADGQTNVELPPRKCIFFVRPETGRRCLKRWTGKRLCRLSRSFRTMFWTNCSGADFSSRCASSPFGNGWRRGCCCAKRTTPISSRCWRKA